ncbi:MAG: PAS domain S-box protein [Deltaproteobacteria bacterium]|nr:PAS domain S-box protein [Candidatus Anaeroferrophillus wilburensis]MBN2890094.1 PAS domain S-box protein [Deltaproteobacteria bacterium]
MNSDHDFLAFEQELQHSQQQYRLLVEQVNSIILRLDAQGRILYLNPFAESFFGFPADELRGKHVVGTIVPDVDEAGNDLRLMINNLFCRPEHYHVNEHENICKNGQRVWVSWTNKGLYDAAGTLTEIFCIGHDVTG